MNLKLELLQNALFQAVREGLACAEMSGEIDACEIADTTAIKALSEIQEILRCDKEKSDFEIVDEIVDVFGKYHLDFGGCHDF